MAKKILLTSFTTWLSHHTSNASDDLLAEVQQRGSERGELIFLRQLPVDIDAAAENAIALIKQQQPHAIICCGMAEKSEKLRLESCARFEEEILTTSVNLEALVKELSYTEISHDAGKFVCEGLYYQVLKYLQASATLIPCIFLHVPLITSENHSVILDDFFLILQHLEQL